MKIKGLGFKSSDGNKFMRNITKYYDKKKKKGSWNFIMEMTSTLASSRGLVFSGSSWANRINFPSSNLKLAGSDYSLHFRYLCLHFFFLVTNIIF